MTDDNPNVDPEGCGEAMKGCLLLGCLLLASVLTCCGGFLGPIIFL